MKKYLSLLAVIAVLSACSSPQKQAHGPTSEDQPDAVIARIDRMTERPSWVKESETFRVENGMVILTGKQTISGDQNVEQAYRAAESNAKSGVAKAIEQKMQFVFQNAEEGYSVDANQARYIGMDATEIMPTSSIRPYKRYWEKYRTTLDSGERVTRIDVYALVQMPEADFKRAVLDAARKRQGKGGLSNEFAKKVDAQWDQFVKPPVEVRAPSAE